MIALDTNVLARYLLADDKRQHRAAVKLLRRRENELWLPITVVLELEWVLRTVGNSRAEIVRGIGDVLRLRNIRAQHADAVERALAWHEKGLDFADALHLALSQAAESLVSFDTKFKKRAVRLAIHPSVSRP